MMDKCELHKRMDQNAVLFELDNLRLENKRLRAALEEIAKWGQTGYCAFDIARKALANKEGE